LLVSDLELPHAHSATPAKPVATGIIFSRANSRLETPQLRPLDILRQNLEINNFPIKKIERERERDAAEHEMAELRSRMKKRLLTDCANCNKRWMSESREKQTLL
jgi:hypothetical protein